MDVVKTSQISGFVELDGWNNIYLDGVNLEEKIKLALEKLGYYVDILENELKISNIRISLYSSKTKMELEEMQDNLVKASLGLEYSTDWAGYSEFSVMDFWIDSFKTGGHDLLEIIKTLDKKYIILIFEQLA